MRIDLIRYNSTNNYTDGMLLIDGKFQCYTIEDEGRTKKMYGETRIPNGYYDVTFRKEGRFHNKYTNKFDFHKGMLLISNAPDSKLVTKKMEFQYILIHIGKTDKDTAGCILITWESYSMKFQKDNTANRLTAEHGTKQYGRLTVMASVHVKCKKLFRVSRNMFLPQPRVHSVVVELKREAPNYEVKDVKIFDEVVRAMFSHRRKTLKNALKTNIKVNNRVFFFINS